MYTVQLLESPTRGSAISRTETACSTLRHSDRVRLQTPSPGPTHTSAPLGGSSACGRMEGADRRGLDPDGWSESRHIRGELDQESLELYSM